MATSRTLSSLFITITVVLVIGLFQVAEGREMKKKGDSTIMVKDFGATIMKCLQDIAGQVGKAFEESKFEFQTMLKSVMKGPCKELVSGLMGSMGKFKLGDFIKM